MEREANGLDRNGFVRVGGLGVCDADEICHAGGLGRVHHRDGGGGRDKIKISRAGGLGVRDASNCDGGGGGRDEMSRAGGVGRIHRDGGGGFIFLHF